MSFLLTLLILALIFGTIYWFKNKNSRGKAVKVEHEYFSHLWLWPKGEHTRWEAEYDIKSEYSNGTVGLHAEDNYEKMEEPNPTKSEIEFSKKYISNLELIFPVALEGVKQGWRDWFNEEIPENWYKEFIIDGFSVPTNGDFKNNWSITLFCEKAGHYFSLAVENGISKLESIDG